MLCYAMLTSLTCRPPVCFYPWRPKVHISPTSHYSAGAFQPVAYHHQMVICEGKSSRLIGVDLPPRYTLIAFIHMWDAENDFWARWIYHQWRRESWGRNNQEFNVPDCCYAVIVCCPLTNGDNMLMRLSLRLLHDDKSTYTLREHVLL